MFAEHFAGTLAEGGPSTQSPSARRTLALRYALIGSPEVGRDFRERPPAAAKHRHGSARALRSAAVSASPGHRVPDGFPGAGRSRCGRHGTPRPERPARGADRSARVPQGGPGDTPLPNGGRQGPLFRREPGPQRTLFGGGARQAASDGVPEWAAQGRSSERDRRSRGNVVKPLALTAFPRERPGGSPSLRGPLGRRLTRSKGGFGTAPDVLVASARPRHGWWRPRHRSTGQLSEARLVRDDRNGLDQVDEAAGGDGVRHRRTGRRHAGAPSGGCSSTRGLYSTSWMRPSKVRCSIISRATSG